MLWDLNPKKRKEISFVIPVASNIVEGDTITCGLKSKYTITEIVSKVPSKMDGMYYIIAKINWSKI